MTMRICIRRATTLALTLAFGLTAIAQQPNEAEKKKINSIKKSDQYIYCEVTTDEQQKAIDLAEEGLDVEINRWVAQQKKFRDSPQYVARNTNSYWERITLPRGNMYRVFVYVKKSDILPADNARTGKNPQTAKVDNITFNSPGGSVEVAKAPAKEPVKAAPTPTPTPPSRYDIVVNRLKGIEKKDEVMTHVRQMKAEGLIRQYETYKKLADPSEYVLVVYNREGVVEALLSEGVQRVNLRNGQPDSVENYKGRGALGIKINK